MKSSKKVYILFLILMGCIFTFSVQADASETRHTTFYNLTSGEEYLFLYVKDMTRDDLVSSENLLYIDQKNTENQDTLSFSYTPRGSDEGTAILKGNNSQNALELTWNLGDDGTLSILGKGYLKDFDTVNPAPWYSESEKIKTVIINESVTKIGSCFFEGCSDLQYITFMGDAPSFSENCFQGLEMNVYYPDGNETWTEDVKQDYGGVITWIASSEMSSPIEKDEQIISGPDSHSVTYGDASFNLNCKLMKGNGTLSYDSDNEKVASVDIYGNVAVHKAGTVNIMVTASETEKYKSAEKLVCITVNRAQQKIDVSLDTDKLHIGQTIAIIAKSDTGLLSYASDNDTVLSVSEEGFVTGNGVGSANIIIRSAENDNYLESSMRVPFSVLENEKQYISLVNCSVQLSQNTYVYDGTEKRPEVLVMYGSHALMEGTDYKLWYSDNVDSGEAIVHISAIADSGFTGNTSALFTIRQALPQLAFAATSFDKTYGDAGFSGALKICQTDGTVFYSSGNTNVAIVDDNSGKIVIKGIGTTTITAKASAGRNYMSGEASFTLKVSKAENTIKVSNITRKYSNKTQKMSIGAKANEGAKLKYKSDNKSVKVNSMGKITIAPNFIGKAQITITSAATANYKAASQKMIVTVNPSGTNIKNITNVKGKKAVVIWKKSSISTGYQLQYSTNKSFTSGVKSKTLSKSGVTKLTLSGLQKKKTYYVRIRTYKTVKKVKYYSSWSSVKRVRIIK